MNGVIAWGKRKEIKTIGEPDLISFLEIPVVFQHKDCYDIITREWYRARIVEKLEPLIMKTYQLMDALPVIDRMNCWLTIVNDDAENPHGVIKIYLYWGSS